jgi:Tol biopolymer transport system component
LANGFSFAEAISADGRYVLFTSEASNLVNGDTNGERDAFVHDRQTGQTSRVSVASNGSQANGGTSFGSMSGNGRYVVFSTRASNLVNNDTNNWFDIFVHDRQTGQTSRVSVASDGSQGNDNSDYPSISTNGRYVAFESYASNLVDNDTNGAPDIFVHDRQTQQTNLISIAYDGNPANAGSYEPSISGDGRYVAFSSLASNLVNDNDTNNVLDVFVYDRQITQTSRVSVDLNGNPVPGGSASPSISADGRYVAFSSNASNLVAGDTNNHEDIFVRDLQTSQTHLISLSYDDHQAEGHSYYPKISPDGQYIAFWSHANNLVVDDNNPFSCDPFFTDWESPH